MNPVTSPTIISPRRLNPRAPAARPVSEVETGKELYSATIITSTGRYVSTGLIFALSARTTDEDARRYRSILDNQGQQGLLRILTNSDLGYISATGQSRRDLLLVQESEVDGRRRIVAAFEQWPGFYELRGGYHSLDYPFSLIELIVDQRGHGSGTFIALAQVRLARDRRSERLSLDVDSFGSFPAKVVGLLRHG